MEIQREAIVEIVGTQYEGRAVNHKNLTNSNKLSIKHQCNNTHDPNAVIVLNNYGEELGFLPKGYASIYAPAIDSGRYFFSIEIVKAEFDPERPILIIKIISDLKNRNEEEIEKSILDFVQNIVNGYVQEKTEYNKYIYAETVDVDELLSSLNNVRLIQKLHSCSSDIIKSHNIVQNSSEYKIRNKDELVKYLNDCKADVNDILKKIQKRYNESFEIDDEEEYYRIQSESRETRKKFRDYNDLLASFLETIESYTNITITFPDTSSVQKTADMMPENSSDMQAPESMPETVHKASISEPQVLTERAFFEWLISQGGVTDTTARQYISSIHSIEKLYCDIFGKKKIILGILSEYNVKNTIEDLIQKQEYIDANERRHNSFSASLNKFIQFSGISVTGLKNAIEKKKHTTPGGYDSLSIKIEYGTKETDNSDTETKKYLITSPAQEPTVSDDKSENHESSCFKIPKPLVTESNAQTESADIRNNDVPAPAKFTPNTSKPFELKNAIIEIMSSDAPEITSHYEYNNGFSSNVLCNLIKTYYGKTVDQFELSLLIINDKAFKSVGKCCYTLSEAADANIEETIEKIAENVYVDKTPFRREYDVIDNSNTIAEETLKTDTIIDIIRENSDNLQYEDGFGSYEVKNLLSNKGISNVSEEQIEALMSQCPELQEIEEGYYILAEENSINETPADQTADIEIIPENEVAERIQTETIPEESFSLDADTRHIILKLNGNTIRAFDHTDALKKICEFSINCKPFRMARIANKGIKLHGNNAFYRKAVPIDGYNKLSNGLQIIKIDSIDDLKFITEEIKKYCHISDDMITIVSKQGDK